MEISSRARPARQKSRATSLMVLPPRLLQTKGKSLNCAPRDELVRVTSSLPYRQVSPVASNKDLPFRISI